MPAFVALLRGINVGGRNKLPMTELRALFTALGHEDVATYIQSGNVVFRSASGDPEENVTRIERAIGETFGLEISVVLRTAAELDAISAANPFPDVDLAKLHVLFLSGEPSPGAVAQLDPDRSPGDELHVAGREIYLRFPNGAGRTKLTLDYFERILGLRGTARNWNTVLELRRLVT